MRRQNRAHSWSDGKQKKNKESFSFAKLIWQKFLYRQFMTSLLSHFSIVIIEQRASSFRVSPKSEKLRTQRNERKRQTWWITIDSFVKLYPWSFLIARNKMALNIDLLLRVRWLCPRQKGFCCNGMEHCEAPGRVRRRHLPPSNYLQVPLIVSTIVRTSTVDIVP